ncbi:MAG: CPBP family intramembrane metalloprotease [Bdellovibrionaceae bacterium]|jgi:membrane protease YdiL (CAAX protease family)|nr:CPBP family intramembrane metalloprotease [Pseudobdellovibrionaceae bacterium]
MKKIIFVILASLFFSNIIATTLPKKSFWQEAFSLDLPFEKEVPRSYFWPQVATFILPGFDQWYEGQDSAGTFYTGLAVSGLALSLTTVSYDENNYAYYETDAMEELSIIGGKTYQTAASLSAYASFRSSVRTQKPMGNFLFLKQEETVDELMLAPFDFSMIKRPTTYIPLGILAAYMIDEISNIKNSDPRPIGGNDIIFSGVISYEAGVEEEALFRGWLQPAMMQVFDSEFASVAVTGALFGAAHPVIDGQYPVIQTVAGWYLGYLTVKNNWTLRESIFLHTWWDIIAFTGGFIANAQGGENVVYLPKFRMQF